MANILVGVLLMFSSLVHIGTSFKACTSWYGQPFHGMKTASGEIFHKDAFTAAHKTLPFGTRLKLRNPKNGRETVVRINDRGPFVRGRTLDVSERVAELLGFKEEGAAELEAIILSSPFNKKE